jgi:hypothetical protein
MWVDVYINVKMSTARFNGNAWLRHDHVAEWCQPNEMHRIATWMFLNLVIGWAFPPPLLITTVDKLWSQAARAGHKNGVHGSMDHDGRGEDFASQDENTVSGVHQSTTVAIVTKIEEVLQSRTMSAIFYSFNIWENQRKEENTVERNSRGKL